MTHSICPNCGHPVDRPARLSPTQSAVFSIIKRAGQTGIESDAIIERVHANKKKPLNPQNSLWHLIHRVNIVLRRQKGVEIYSYHNGPYPARYFLRKIPAWTPTDKKPNPSSTTSRASSDSVPADLPSLLTALQKELTLSELAQLRNSSPSFRALTNADQPPQIRVPPR